jgi:DNA-directed RNA polymerase beta subunit
MPTHTVIYRGLKDNKINYMNVNRYTFLHDGFGYINDCPAADMLSVENIIPKDACLQQSPAWRTGDYAYGLNGNVIFTTDDAVTEDAMVISESFAKRCTNLAIHRIKLNMSADDVLLNLYGDKEIDEYKVIPNIGETVREDGVLAAIRAKNAASYVSDMTMDALQRIEPMHDELHKAPPGSKILDVDVYINFDYLKKLDPSDSVYEQLLKIYNDHQYYYDEVIQCYQEYVQQGLEISEDFNTLVLRCMELTCNRKYSKKNIKLCDPREPIEFITVAITYSYEREISLGSKLTGREGKQLSPAVERSAA